MSSDIYALYGKQINRILDESSGLSKRKDEFRLLFINKDVLDSEDLPADFRRFLEKLLLVIDLMRNPCGTTLRQLGIATEMSEIEVRRCIRIIINAGGDVEFRKQRQGATAGSFILHD